MMTRTQSPVVGTGHARWLCCGVLSLVFAAAAPGLEVCADNKLPQLPLRFPFDSYVLRGVVIEPVLPLGDASPAGGGWVLQVEVTTPVHLPETNRRFDVQLFDADCIGVSRQALIDRFATGDEIDLVAYPAANTSVAERSPHLLLAPSDWMRLSDESLLPGVQTPFEYFAALFRIEYLATDVERISPLRSLAAYVVDEERYSELLRMHLRGRQLRKQLKAVHKALRTRQP